ncbi:MAG: hypothetical protein ACUVR2_10140 [Anaerolineae bacterium]
MVTYTHWICDYNIYFNVADMPQIQPVMCLTVLTLYLPFMAHKHYTVGDA